MADRSSFAYEAYVPDPIASLRSNLSDDAATAVLDAVRAVSELQLETTFAGLEALSCQLLRAESVASSRIEGFRLSQRRLAKALLSPADADADAAADADADAAAREVVGNIEAMQAAIELGSRWPNTLDPTQARPASSTRFLVCRLWMHAPWPPY